MAYDEFDPYKHWLEIEPSEHPVDHYRLLGIARFEDDLAKIALAADERMQRVRSYQTGPRGIHTQRLLNELSAAKLRLLDPVSKQQYDERLRVGPSEDSEFLQKLDEAVLPPGVDTELTTSTDPMAPLVMPSDPRKTTPSFPAIQIATTGPRRPASAARRPVPVDPPTSEGTEPVKRVPQGVVGHLLIFLSGVVVVATSVWFVGSLYWVDESHLNLNSTEISSEHPRSEVWGTGRSSSSTHISQQPDGSFFLSGDNVQIEGASARVVRDEAGTTIRDWVQSEDVLRWRVMVERGNLFDGHLTYAVDEQAAEGSIRITLGGRAKSWDLRSSGGVESFVTDVFRIGVDGPGEYTLTLEAIKKPGREVMRFRSLELKPFLSARN